MEKVTSNSLETFVLENQEHLEKIKRSLSEFNIFNVLGVQHREIRHSNFIGWLFDPNESHQLGDIFLKDLFKLLRQKKMISSEKMVSLLLENLETTQVYRESKNNIDILIVNTDLNVLICIENKIYHHYSKDQLEKYYEYIEQNYIGITDKLYVTLTPYKSDSHKSLSKGDKYTNITYKELIDILTNNIEFINKTLPTVKESIYQYIRMVKKDIMHNTKEIKLAREIYGKYKNEINFIVNNSLNLAKQKNSIERFFKNELRENYILSHPNLEQNHIIRILPNDPNFLHLFEYPFFKSWRGDYIFAMEMFFEKTEIFLKLCFGNINLKDNDTRSQAQNIKTDLFDTMKNFSSIQSSNVKVYNSKATSEYSGICKYSLLTDEEVLNSEKSIDTLFRENFEKAEVDFIEPFIEECILKLKMHDSNE